MSEGVGSRPTALTSSAVATASNPQNSNTGKASHHARRCSNTTNRLPMPRSDK
ncbi:hypothetical protein [Pseudomonas sp. H1_D05]